MTGAETKALLSSRKMKNSCLLNLKTLWEKMPGNMGLLKFINFFRTYNLNLIIAKSTYILRGKFSLDRAKIVPLDAPLSAPPNVFL